jgi:hypothetical protein
MQKPSAAVFRFVPDDLDLSHRAVRDCAREVPSEYSPPDLFTGALQHTDPGLSWDEGDKRRKKVKSQPVTPVITCYDVFYMMLLPLTVIISSGNAQQ